MIEKNFVYLIIGLMIVGSAIAINDDMYKIQRGESVYQEKDAFSVIINPEQSIYIHSKIEMLGNSNEGLYYSTYPLRDVWSLQWLIKTQCYSITTKNYGTKKVYVLDTGASCKNNSEINKKLVLIATSEIPYYRTYGNPKTQPSKSYIKITNPTIGQILNGIITATYEGTGFNSVSYYYNYENTGYTLGNTLPTGTFWTVDTTTAPNGNYELQLQTDNGLTTNSGTFSVQN